MGTRDSETQKRAGRIVKKLKMAHTGVEVELDHSNPFELLVATVLSAQCTDAQVNRVTPGLFARYPDAGALALADTSALEQIIHPTGFYRNKAKNLISCSQQLVEKHKGIVPNTMEELTALPGIGRKTANVVLGACFKQPAIVVDTHVKRVANRLGLTRSADPTQIEHDLQALLPPKDWTAGAQRFLLHGRYVCVARTPKCDSCIIYQDCPWEGKQALAC